MRTIATIITAAALAGAAAAPADASYPRAVSLSDASSAPSFLHLVKPGRSYLTLTQCRGDSYFSDTSAYRWNGQQLSAQRWDRDRTITFWRDRRGGRVTFDGIVWRNRTHRSVLVAGWCG